MTARADDSLAVSQDAIRLMAAELGETASHPEFLRIMESVQAAENTRAVAEDVARVEHLAANGIPIPDAFRITTRTFEDPHDQPKGSARAHGNSVVIYEGDGATVIHYRGTAVTIRERSAKREEAEEVPSRVVSPRVVSAEIKTGIEAIGRFVASPPFQRALAELAELDQEARERFVSEELLNSTRRKLRGIVPPDGMIIQRSRFADGRPTLFCVSMELLSCASVAQGHNHVRQSVGSRLVVQP
jgi:hypothetical protein